MRELQQGKLSIAANEFTALYLLPVLAEFRRLHPMIKIAVQRTLGRNIPEDVLRHNCELGVLTYDPQTPQLRSAVVYQDELVLVVPPNHPLGQRITSKHPATGSRILRGPQRFFSLQGESNRSLQAPQNPAAHGHRTPHPAGHKKFRGGRKRSGVSSEISVENELVRGELRRIPVKELRLHRKLRLVYRKAASISHAAKAFLKVAENIAN